LNVTAKELRLTSLDAAYHNQNIKLLSPARLSFADGFTIEGLKVGAQEAVVQVDGRVSPALDVRASLDQLKPDLINAFVPGLLASGTIKSPCGTAITPPGPLAIFIVLALFALIVAVVVAVFLGAVLIWIPVLILVLGAALVAATVRRRWQQFQHWLMRR